MSETFHFRKDAETWARHTEAKVWNRRSSPRCKDAPDDYPCRSRQALQGRHHGCEARS